MTWTIDSWNKGCARTHHFCFQCATKDTCSIRESHKVCVLRKGVLIEGKLLSQDLGGGVWVELPEGNCLLYTKEVMPLEKGSQKTLELYLMWKARK
jgi:hypothetical protein